MTQPTTQPTTQPASPPASTWSYRPGEWLAIFGATSTLLLPASEKARAARLWDLLDGGAGFDATLDEVLAPGLSALPAFVLIGAETPEVSATPETSGTPEAPTTRVIVRGSGVRARLSTEAGTVELDGSAVGTWVERTLAGIVSLSVVVDGDSAEGPDHLIEGGLVRVARIDLPPYAAPLAAPGVPEPPQEPTEQPRSEGPDEGLGEGLGEGLDVDVPETELYSLEQLQDDTSGGLSADEVAQVAGLSGVVGGGGVADHDGLTHAGAPSGAILRSQPGIPGQPPAPALTRAVARLEVSNGDVVEVDRVVLIGRAPEARGPAADEQRRMVVVPSPLQEISSTHLEVRPGSGVDHGSAVVTDLGSTNGTVLAQPGLDPEDLRPGVAVQLLPGAVIDLGDGVTIQVTHP